MEFTRRQTLPGWAQRTLAILGAASHAGWICQRVGGRDLRWTNARNGVEVWATPLFGRGELSIDVVRDHQIIGASMFRGIAWPEDPEAGAAVYLRVVAPLLRDLNRAGAMTKDEGGSEAWS